MEGFTHYTIDGKGDYTIVTVVRGGGDLGDPRYNQLMLMRNTKDCETRAVYYKQLNRKERGK